MPKVILDTPEAIESRRQSNARADAFLRKSTHERPKFSSVTEMLCWYFALRGETPGVPAIDPSADRINGLRDERVGERRYWIVKIEEALRALVQAQSSSTGALLLLLALRPRVLTGYREKRGIRVPVYLEPTPVWELYREPVVEALGLSQRKARSAFWAAMEELEIYARNRGWIEASPDRKSRAEQVYRRQQ